MYQNKKLSVVIPCYNEEEGIVSTIKKVPSVIDEIVVVDNNSKDNTAKVAQRAGAKVVLEKRKGYGYALKAGIKNASGDIIITIDGDATYPIEDTQEIVKYLLDKDLDFVSGNRLPLSNKKAMSFTNILGTKVLNFFTLLLFQKRFKDILSGMWVFRKNCYRKLTLVSNDWNISEEIKIEVAQKCKFQEFHINHHQRLGKTKLLKWRVGIENLIFLFWKRISPQKNLPKFLKLT